MSRGIKDIDKTGVITFLDVLGWKGIYGRKSNPIDTLELLLDEISTLKTQLRGKISNMSYDVNTKSISDTIVLFTPCSEIEAPVVINLHGAHCQRIIPRSIELGIPVRGAISFGEYENIKNIFVGKAVDEAASWHEQADWIGVQLTPSAEYLLDRKKIDDVWVEFTPATKASLKWKSHCVNWTVDWQDRNGEINQIKRKLWQLGPILPEIAGKFINTLEFIEKIGQNASSLKAEEET
ncbi:hypothetical protein Metho_0638 [Methanomethylovorans hollandica DSM 15978]|uniref:Uncharacterized protein n=1 Tax=Methanomethylovorans hollandica (strain DSM 15978 / NBRC 107637 / DMS1) TaxID=867904 RepID=L0KY44_METHD|nr:hypothetical protein [Methanomethylovorans hollandica]AGB48894.1 hypothetical protein Metho_0638 [Methanomethylovorans hollandica DSM 15978]